MAQTFNHHSLSYWCYGIFAISFTIRTPTTRSSKLTVSFACTDVTTTAETTVVSFTCVHPTKTHLECGNHFADILLFSNSLRIAVFWFSIRLKVRIMNCVFKNRSETTCRGKSPKGPINRETLTLTAKKTTQGPHDGFPRRKTHRPKHSVLSMFIYMLL